MRLLYKKHDFNPPHQIECNDIRMMLSLLRNNLGIGIMSYLDAYAFIENGEFEFRTIHENGLHPITLALCIASKRQTLTNITNYDESNHWTHGSTKIAHDWDYPVNKLD